MENMYIKSNLGVILTIINISLIATIGTALLNLNSILA